MDFWSTVGQIVNFIIFVVVLHYLLYRPVKRIMQSRREEMESDLRQAEAQRAEAEKIRLDADARARELEEKRDGILQDARDQAEEHRREALTRAEQQARERLARFRRVMEQERDELLANVTDELRTTIVEVSAAVLADASDRLADRALERVAALLAEMSDADAESARKALAESANRATVRSAGPLDAPQQERLRKLLSDKLGLADLQIEVADAPQLLAGLEITLGHVSLSAHWRDVIDQALKHSALGAATPGKAEPAPGVKGKSQNADE